MWLLIKVLLLLITVQFISAAQDYKINVFACRSLVGLALDTKVCAFKGTSVSIEVNVTQPQSSLTVQTSFKAFTLTGQNRLAGDD